MKRNRSIQLKAAFLLLVFGLNTVVGFACSLGLDMGFNIPHHKEEVSASPIHIHKAGKHEHQKETAKTSIHVHADGKKHVHQTQPAAPAINIHADGKKHVHQQEPVAQPAAHIHADGKKHEHPSPVANQHAEEKKIPKNTKDDCCKDDVLKFQNLDKNLVLKAKTIIETSSLIVFLTTFFPLNISQSVPSPVLPAVRYLFPPPPNILIVIHRFQV